MQMQEKVTGSYGNYNLQCDAANCLVKSTLTLNTATEEQDPTWMPKLTITNNTTGAQTKVQMVGNGSDNSIPGTIKYFYKYDLKSDLFGISGSYSFQSKGEWREKREELGSDGQVNLNCLAGPGPGPGP